MDKHNLRGRTPLTILNGFLGAGKTTLLKSLIFKLHTKKVRLAVIVNDMSELDIDGVIIANTELVSKEQLNFVSISATSISSNEGIEKLDIAICKLQAEFDPDIILLETSGSSHPAPLLRYFNEHPKVALKGFLTLVDAVMLKEDYDSGKKLIGVFQRNLSAGTHSIENLLVEQIMLSSKLLLTKVDRIQTDIISNIAQELHPLNPYVDIIATQWGELDPEVIFSLPDYNFHLVSKLLEEMEDAFELTPGGGIGYPFELTTQVIDDPRPFHPQRLWDTCQRFLGRGIHRSKGFFWMASRDDLALLWNQVAGSINLEFVSYWKAGVLAHNNNGLTVEEREALEKQLAKKCSRFGDRQCRLTVIGESKDVAEFTRALRRCFCTELEIEDWLNGGAFDDPWPKRVVRLKAKQ
ncbi:CobW family GTP-binding protein [Obesumbacterium proteus]|uniref:Metal chaperone/GTPase n=1 Tax=Obesumbacterium proteus ATCC 12841 TaxID=1354268 RepID=A0AA91EDZ8_9GAMM|nr:GTP-binding protein [Obesumbacterium proteus]AMO83751.1 cobalamin biosynthesis protein CobW [Obesumbacterium proteus]OAT58920.1 putative metal chaperone/GTPase [Obesumbacterium proteus ATCC 12841]